jgi:hypothetical protein
MLGGHISRLDRRVKFSTGRLATRGDPRCKLRSRCGREPYRLLADDEWR